MTIEEMVEDCVSDTSVNGKYYKLYRALINEIDLKFSDKRLNSIIGTLSYVGINCQGMSKSEILFEYSKLI